MSDIDTLISKTRDLGLYPFVYSVSDTGPGAIIDRAPHYLPYGNILSPEYALAGGAQPIVAALNIPANAGVVAAPTSNAAQIADIFVQQTFSAKASVSLAYQDVTLDAALDIGFKYSGNLKVETAGLVELSYPGLDRNSLAAAFSQPAVINAPPTTALGQIVRDMKTRDPVWVFGPRPLDIAQFIVAARGLRLTWTAATQFSADLKAEFKTLTANNNNFTLGASIDQNGTSSVSVEWKDIGKPMPVLWFPWRYAWTGTMFESVSR